MNRLTQLFSVTVLASTMAMSLSTQAAEELDVQPITDLTVKQNIETVKQQMARQINQDIQASLTNTMLASRVSENTVLLAKSMNQTVTLVKSEAVE